jgi:hypothetical protein
MAETTTIQQREQTLASLFAVYQTKANDESKLIDEITSMQATLDADTEKYSTTILNWRGEVMRRIDLQGYLNARAARLPSVTSEKLAAKANYDQYKTIMDSINQAELVAANPNLAVDLHKADLEAQIKAKESETLAQGKVFAQKSTQYLIIGGVVVAILIIVAFSWKRIFV